MKYSDIKELKLVNVGGLANKTFRPTAMHPRLSAASGCDRNVKNLHHIHNDRKRDQIPSRVRSRQKQAACLHARLILPTYGEQRELEMRSIIRAKKENRLFRTPSCTSHAVLLSLTLIPARPIRPFVMPEPRKRKDRET